jgi:hypothetical protein
MKTLKKLNFGILSAFFGLALVFGLSAFQPKTDTLYWFEVNTSNGTILSYQGHEAPGGDCTSDLTSRPVCSVAFDEADISDPMDPTAPISNVNSDPSSTIDEKKRLEE